jgi:hypothetical protein
MLLDKPHWTNLQSGSCMNFSAAMLVDELDLLSGGHVGAF